MESPLQNLIDRIDGKDLAGMEPRELGQLMLDVHELRGGLIEDPQPLPKENVPWVVQAIKDFTRQIVTINWHAQKKVNPWLEIDLLEEIGEAMEEKQVADAIDYFEKFRY